MLTINVLVSFVVTVHIHKAIRNGFLTEAGVGKETRRTWEAFSKHNLDFLSQNL